MRFMMFVSLLLAVVAMPLAAQAVQPNLVYRADDVTPAQAKANGGFRPRALNNYPTRQPPPDLSLYRHQIGGVAEGMDRDNSGYVATTTSLRFAHIWLQVDDGNGYIYHIQPTANFVDVNASLGPFSLMPTQQEHAALGRIYWEQVRGWQQVSDGVLGIYEANPDYNARLYDNMVGAGAVPSLAGFPDNHQAWRMEPWSAFADCTGPSRSKRNDDELQCVAKVKPNIVGEQYFALHDVLHRLMATE
ncbi:enterotoxin A family protein [Carnimonas bestiolae]|uniref:enterotoxin A family protein n=1 Tax=Carnimonas bestiolae TaxID=3402172 RepID=UPI003EDBA970